MILWLRVHTALPVDMSLVPVLGGIEPPVTHSQRIQCSLLASISTYTSIHKHTYAHLNIKKKQHKSNLVSICIAVCWVSD